MIPNHPDSVSVDIKAYFVATGNIDIKNLYMYQQYPREVQKKSVNVTLDKLANSYISIFKYGSVVFFNVPEEVQFAHLKLIREVSIAPIENENLLLCSHYDTYKVVIREDLESHSSIKGPHILVKNLDANNVTIVSTVMAQTVALDHFADMVEKMSDTFMRMNVKIEETGQFDQIDAKGLHKLVAKNNVLIATVLSKVFIYLFIYFVF
jgi:uncharacterized Rmd1/YagE family protein